MVEELEQRFAEPDEEGRDTEQGELLHRTAREVFAKLSMTEAMLTESREHPKGPLRVTTTVAFGSTWLTPRISRTGVTEV